jgi:hypothetical protein
MRTGLPGIADVASSAGSYALFGGVLVAFSLAGLFWYLTDEYTRSRAREQEDTGRGKAASRTHEGRVPLRRGSQWTPTDIGIRHVTLTILYAMASLTMTSFLYTNLSGEAIPPENAPGGSPSWAVAALSSASVMGPG